MACCVNNQTQTTATLSRGYIYTTVEKIDQLQKEVKMQSACEGCEGSLMSTFYNTKPVTFYLCGGETFTATVPGTTTTTTVFRIEDVRDDSVILRMLTANDTGYDCTNYTVVLCIRCVCALQCFAPICCETCNRNCGE